MTGQLQVRVRQVSELIDSSNPDLSAFFAHGGKLILHENMAELAQSPLAGINYFTSVVAKLGRPTVDRFARLYVSPASTHSGNGASVTTATAVPTMIDLLGPLDEWVSSGTPPREPLVQTRRDPVAPFAMRGSRPLWLHADGARLGDHVWVGAKSIPGARMVVLEGMGRALPVRLRPFIIDTVARHARQVKR